MNATQDNLLDRSVSVATDAIMDAGTSPTWLRQTVESVILNAAAELIAIEQLTGHPMTLQDAVKFLCDGAEGRT